MVSHVNSVPVSITRVHRAEEWLFRPTNTTVFNPTWAPYWAQGGKGAVLTQEVVENGVTQEQSFQVRTRNVTGGGYDFYGAQDYTLRGGGAISAYFGMRWIA